MILVLLGSLLNAAFISNLILTNQGGIEQITNGKNRIKEVLKYTLWVGLYTLIVFVLMYVINLVFISPYGLDYLNTFLTAVIMVVVSILSTRFIKNNEYFNNNKNKILLNTVTILIVLLVIKEANFLIGLSLLIGYLLGYSLVMSIYSLTMYKLLIAPVPKPFQGLAVGLIILALLSIAFYGMSGLF